MRHQVFTSSTLAAVLALANSAWPEKSASCGDPAPAHRMDGCTFGTDVDAAGSSQVALAYCNLGNAHVARGYREKAIADNCAAIARFPPFAGPVHEGARQGPRMLDAAFE